MTMLKHIKKYIIALAIMLAVYFLLVMGKSLMAPTLEDNSNATTDYRVFDYADKLTDRQEEKLEALISKREKQTGYSIVLVTLDEDLSEWAEDNEDLIDEYGYGPDYYNMNMSDGSRYSDICSYANVFWDEHQFGFNGYDESDYFSGDGVIFVDNWYDGNTWLATSGKRSLVDKYDDDYGAKSYHIIDMVCKLDRISPYLAYKAYVNTIYYDKYEAINFNGSINLFFIIPLIAIILGIICTAYQKSKIKTKNTVNAYTYVKNGKPVINSSSETLINRYVTKQIIQSSSSGAGGIGRSGGFSGGHSHGGHGGHH